MSVGRVAVVFGVAGVVVGAVARALEGDWSLALIALSLTGLIVILLRRVARTTSILTGQRGKLQGLQRSVLWHQKEILKSTQSVLRATEQWHAGSASHQSPSPTTEPAATTRKSVGPGLGDDARRWGGRASTPDVKNPRVSEETALALSSERMPVIAGVFDEANVPGAESVQWAPGKVLLSLTSRPPTAVLIDMQQLGRGRWFGAFSASGTRLMTELLQGVRWCKERSTPCYVLPSGVPVDVNSRALLHSGAVVLPLDEATAQQAEGAPISPFLRTLQEVAAKRAVRK